MPDVKGFTKDQRRRRQHQVRGIQACGQEAQAVSRPGVLSSQNILQLSCYDSYYNRDVILFRVQFLCSVEDVLAFDLP